MDFTRFSVDAIGSALALGLATPDDVLRHATPDLLSKHLPRPLFSKLIQACLASPRTDARLIVDTVGVPALCTHIPGPIIWACLAEIGARALGRSAPSPSPAARPTDVALTPPPAGASPGVATAAAAPVAIGVQPSAPVQAAGTTAARVPQAETPAPLGAPPQPGQRLPTGRVETVGPAPVAKPGPTAPAAGGNGARAVTAGASTRRVQPAGGGPTTNGPPPAPGKGRAGTEPVEVDVDEEQLVDWAQAEMSAPSRDEHHRKG